MARQGSRSGQAAPESPPPPLLPRFRGLGVLLLTLIAVFYIKVIRDGRDAATSRQGSESVVDHRGRAVDTKTTAQHDLARWRETGRLAAQGKETRTVKDDVKNLTVIQAAKKEDKRTSKERKFVTSTMTALSKNCGADYTVNLTRDERRARLKSPTLASGRSW